LVEATGIEGLRLGDLGDPAAARVEDLKTCPLFQCADELGLNVNIFTSGDQVPCVEMLAAAFPQVPISLDHLGVMPTTPGFVDRWGRPRSDDEPLPPAAFPRILAMARFPNVYIKVSGEYAVSKGPWPYADMKPMVEQIYRAYGPERMMWCTDSPWILEEPGYQKLVDLLDGHLPSLSQEEKDQIMGGTALGIWFKK
jgi:predicted TIM-barrel fold metal-dependent hydrolase